MSYSAEWLAVSGIGKDEILSRLSLSDTGIVEEEFMEGIFGHDLSPDWYILFGVEPGLVMDTNVAKFSAGCRVISAEISESVMSSCVAEYRDGECQWEIIHIGDEGIFDLNVDGTPPPEFSEIKDKAIQKQKSLGGEDAEIDIIFDIPIVLAHVICGFRHDFFETDEDGILPQFTRLTSK